MEPVKQTINHATTKYHLTLHVCGEPAHAVVIVTSDIDPSTGDRVDTTSVESLIGLSGQTYIPINLDRHELRLLHDQIESLLSHATEVSDSTQERESENG